MAKTIGNKEPERQAYRINDLCRAYGVGRTTVFKLIKAGKLQTVLVGRIRLVSREAADAALLSQAA